MQLQEIEARRISERTNTALAVYKARGGQLGNPKNLTTKAAKKGNAANAAAADKYQAEILPTAEKLRGAGRSLTENAETLTGRGLLTRRGKSRLAACAPSLPEGIKSNDTAVAETIENNVRSKIVKEHLNDPAYYAQMSTQLQEIIAARKAKAVSYEEYLQRIAELAKRVAAGQSEDTPSELDTAGKRAIFNNLIAPSVEQSTGQLDRVAEQQEPFNSPKQLGGQEALELALKIDQTVKLVRPDAWRGEQTKERVIKAALHGILQDVNEVERLFKIIFEQRQDY